MKELLIILRNGRDVVLRFDYVSDARASHDAILNGMSSKTITTIHATPDDGLRTTIRGDDVSAVSVRDVP